MRRCPAGHALSGVNGVGRQGSVRASTVGRRARRGDTTLRRRRRCAEVAGTVRRQRRSAGGVACAGRGEARRAGERGRTGWCCARDGVAHGPMASSRACACARACDVAAALERLGCGGFGTRGCVGLPCSVGARGRGGAELVRPWRSPGGACSVGRKGRPSGRRSGAAEQRGRGKAERAG